MKNSFPYRTIHDFDKVFKSYSPDAFAQLAAGGHRELLQHLQYVLINSIDDKGNDHYLLAEYDSIEDKTVDAYYEVSQKDCFELCAFYLTGNYDFLQEEFENILYKAVR